MNTNSRTKNTILNMMSNFLYQIVIVILTFLSRRIFISNLGMDYLGIAGLFSNILDLLTLAELGIGSAISFSMYKHLATKNEKKLQELVSYYKVLYNRIALFILIVGLILLPFLKYIVNLESDIANLELIYLIFLSNSVLSYLFVYKSTIVYADQHDYKIKMINIGIELLKCILQIVSMITFKSYMVYIIIQLVFTLYGNFIRSRMAEKWYPFIKEKAELPESEKKTLWSDIKSMFFYKFGNVAMNHTDNILISMFISTTTVGIFSNYTMIYTKITTFINLIFSSCIASIGNLNVSASGEEKYKMYKVLNFISYILFSIASIGIWFVIEDAIRVISNSNNYLLDKTSLLIIVVNYYLMGVLHPNTIYRQTSGLFKYAKYSMLLCSVLNVILSIILGKFYGLFGIILASVISRILTNIWYEPYTLYTKFFMKNPKEYYLAVIFRTLLTIILIALLTPVINLITMENVYVRIILKTLICGSIPLGVFAIIFRKNEDYIYTKNKAKEILKKIFNKVRI